MSRFQPLRVLEVRTETPDAFTIRFERPQAPDFQYKPGQYITLRVWVNGREERRAFSFSSSPSADAFLSVTIKALEKGVVSNHLRRTLQAGHSVDVLPPQGNFFIHLDPNAARHHLLVGGGSGITPLMSMLKSVLQAEPKSEVTLVYGNRNQACAIFWDDLINLQSQHPNRLRVVHVLSRPEAGWAGKSGRIEGEFAETLLKEATAASPLPTSYYICGPDGLMLGAQQALRNLGVPDTSIKREWYNAPADGAENAAVQAPAGGDPAAEAYEVRTQKVKIKLDGAEYDVTVQPWQHILDAALEFGIDPPYACQEGVCCTCRAKLHSGMVAMDEREGLSDEELKQGFVLTCQSHPLTPDVVLEYC